MVRENRRHGVKPASLALRRSRELFSENMYLNQANEIIASTRSF